MKLTNTATLAALVGSVAAAKDETTFAVLRFTNKQLTRGRMDPIVTPGETSAHVHHVMGASGFGKSSTGETIKDSKCTNAQIVGDNSNYWFPALYFNDPETQKFESVDVFYVNAYYFFEASNDDIKAFPTGLQMVAGQAMSRVAPEGGSVTNLDPSKGPVNPVKWTCPRKDNIYNPPSWPANSDGSNAGIGDPINKGEGVGFPDVSCDGYASPLRADIHFPSCYNPEKGLNDWQNSMAYPEETGTDGKRDCPKGWIHVPHLFLEVYWDTPKFDGRWTPNSGKQPFVLASGDATGFSSHGDFMAGWDEDVLQHIIDTCNAGTPGMNNCPGVTVNTEDCTIPSEVDEVVDGVMDSLPGTNMLAGWSYGLDVPMSMPEPAAPPAPPAPVSSSPSAPKSSAQSQAPAEAKQSAMQAPVAEGPAVVAAAVVQETQAPKPSIVTLAAVASTAEQPKPSASVAPPSPLSTKTTIYTVWETVTVTIDSTEPTKVAATSNDGVIAGFKPAGCYKDSETRVLSSLVPVISSMSNEKCISHCKEAGFLLAGTQYGSECYCGNELVGSEKVDDSVCSLPCAGESADVCGGHWALSIYSQSGEANMKSIKTRRGIHGHLHRHRRSHH